MRQAGVVIPRREVRDISRGLRQEYAALERQAGIPGNRRIPDEDFAIKINPYGEPVDFRQRYNYQFRATFVDPNTGNKVTRYYTWGDKDRLSPTGARKRMERKWVVQGSDPEAVDSIVPELEFVGAYRRTVT